MRSIFVFLGFAIALGSSACSDGGKPAHVAKGNATIVFDSCSYSDAVISSPDGGPKQTDYGGTVSTGNGFSISCKLTPAGASYGISAHLESPSAWMEIQSTDLSQGAAMIFWEGGAGGTPERVRSVDGNNDGAPTCTVTTSRDGTLLAVGPESVFASYDCPKVVASSNASSVCRTSGLFYLTGCGG